MSWSLIDIEQLVFLLCVFNFPSQKKLIHPNESLLPIDNWSPMASGTLLDPKKSSSSPPFASSLPLKREFRLLQDNEVSSSSTTTVHNSERSNTIDDDLLHQKISSDAITVTKCNRNDTYYAMIDIRWVRAGSLQINLKEHCLEIHGALGRANDLQDCGPKWITRTYWLPDTRPSQTVICELKDRYLIVHGQMGGEGTNWKGNESEIDQDDTDWTMIWAFNCVGGTPSCESASGQKFDLLLNVASFAILKFLSFLQKKITPKQWYW